MGLIALGASTSAFGDVIYVDGGTWNGAPAGDGSAAFPFSHFDSAIQLLENGDQILCTGLFTPANGFNSEIRNKSGFSVGQWPSRSLAVFDGGIDIPAGAFQSTGDGTRFVAILLPGLTITTVTEDYRRVSDTDERFMGHLRPVEDLQDVSSTECSWFYDKGTGALSIHTLDGVSPSTSGHAFAFTIPGDGLRIINSDNFRVSDLEFRRICDNTGSEGYGLNIITASNSVVERVRVFDGGAHSLGFTGNDNRNNRIIDCEVFGLHGGLSAQIQIVFFTQGPDMEGNVCVDTTFHLYGSLDPRGESIDPNRDIIGAFQHTAKLATIRPAGLIWRRCTFIGYDGHRSVAWTGSRNNLKPASNPWDRDAHSIILEDCVATNCTGLWIGGDGANVFVDRCFFDLSRRADPIATGGVFATDSAVVIGARDEVTSTTIRSSSIIASTPSGSLDGAAISLFPDANLHIALSTIYFAGAPSHELFVIAGTGDATITSVQNIWARSVEGDFLQHSAPVSKTYFNPVGSRYINTVSPLPADPPAPFDTLIGLAPDDEFSTMATPEPALRSLSDLTQLEQISAPTIWSFNEDVRGINGLLYSGQFGAVQKGSRPCAADFDGNRFVDSSDLAFLLAAWGTLNESLEIDGVPIISSRDLAALLSAWGPCQ